MRLAVLCDPGCEEFAALEAKELLGKEAAPGKGYVIVDDCSFRDAAVLCARSQAAGRVLAVMGTGPIAQPGDVAVPDFDFSPFLAPGGSFRASCARNGDHAFQAREVEAVIGEAIGLPVSLDAPDMTVFCQVVEDAYVLGVDLAGKDLGKRAYKVFHNRRSLRGTVAYAALRAAGYSGKEVLLDPLVTDGSFLIEAALFSSKTSAQKFSPSFAYQKMPGAAGIGVAEEAGEPGRLLGSAEVLPALKAARANAKLAGVEKAFSVTRCELEWLSSKFDAASVDLVVTSPPASGKHTPVRVVEKLLNALFAQAARLLRPGGAVLIVDDKRAEVLNAAAAHGFSLGKGWSVAMGGRPLSFLRFAR